MRSLLWTLAALGFVAIFAVKLGGWAASPSGTGQASGTGATVTPGLALYPPNVRSAAPPLEGHTLTGDKFSLADLKGQLVVLNVWGSWCAPCRAETPDLVKLAHQYTSRGVSFAGINTRDNPAAAKRFVARFQVPYPSVEDTDGRVLLNFRHVIPTAVVPSSVLVDRNGKVAARVIGRVSYSTMKGLLDDELAARSGPR